MGKKQLNHFNVSAPNLINICVDKSSGGEVCGRIYHCYDRNAQEFSNVVQLLGRMEKLFDSINFPQASTRLRYFAEPRKPGKLQETEQPQGARKPQETEKPWETGKTVPEKVAEQQEIICHKGKRGTFLVSVKYRQNSDWQGEVLWEEKNLTKSFSSTIELIKLIDNDCNWNLG